MLHEFGKNTVESLIFFFFMRPKRTNSVKKYGNASRFKKKSAIRPTLPYEHDENPPVVRKSRQNLTAEMNHLKENA